MTIDPLMKPEEISQEFEQKCINTIRFLSVDAVQQANSGHPGMPMGAASLAGHLGLGKLIYIYLDNRITIEGETDLAFSEDVKRRFEGYNWHVQQADGYDLDGAHSALTAAPLGCERYTGIHGRIMGMDRFGVSAPGKVAFEAFGFTVDGVAQKTRELVSSG